MKVKMEIETPDLDEFSEGFWEQGKDEDSLWSNVKFFGLLTFWSLVVAIVVYQTLSSVT